MSAAASARRQLVVRQRAGERDAGHAARGALGRRALRAVADEDGAEPVIAGGMQPRERRRELRDAVPRPERAGKHAQNAVGIARERQRPVRVRPEVIDVGAPLDFEHAAAIDPGRKDVRRRRDEQVGRAGRSDRASAASARRAARDRARALGEPG